MLALCLSTGCHSLSTLQDPDDATADVTDVLSVDRAPTDGATSDSATGDASAIDAVTTDVVAPDVAMADLAAPDLVTTDAVTTDVVTTDAVTTDVVTTDVVAPDVVTTDVVMPVDAGCVTPTAWYLDGDGDGYGSTVTMACAAPPRHVARGGDCNDGDATVAPGLAERCDGVDRDCSGAWTPSVPSTCATIQSALDAATRAAPERAVTISVAAGTYRESLTWRGARAVVRGAGAATTTITAASAGPTVTFDASEGADTGLSGVTVTGGSGRAVTTLTGVYGGGVLVVGASPTLSDLVVRDNTVSGSSGYGAGVALLRSSSTLRRVALTQNTAGYYGGGLYVSQSTGVRLENVDARGNRAVYAGGLAVYFSTVAITNAIVAQNRASAYGGGVLFQGAAPDVTNAAIVGNSAESLGGGVAITSAAAPGALRNVALVDNTSPMGGAVAVASGGVAPTVTYSLYDGNGGVSFSGLATPSPTNGNVAAAPRFVRALGTTSMWDLHPDTGSPLVNAGDPMLRDADGSRSDIGAYGGPNGAMW